MTFLASPIPELDFGSVTHSSVVEELIIPLLRQKYSGSGVLLNLLVAPPFPVVISFNGGAGPLTRSTTL